MAQFDVYSLSTTNDLLLDVQANSLYGVSSRVIVPLVIKNGFFSGAPRLNPEFKLDDETYVMITQLLTSVPANQLRNVVGNLDHEHDRIMIALDMLFLGF